ncbi:hypothetical protein VitviT2T_011153 [Vitis vinifera]|uniref:Ribonucleotide reductase large subunit C-terminal domain-containing protein n=1 Tax=Vitis vinifera TaxID=29760 RepID=A0ABY9CBK6_VITVI|nr:hypothetical protein VitviT2T_011153 [Vitis vinifera]
MAEVYEHVTTSHLDELATAMTANHPNCASLAERIVVSNLHKNTKKSFSETIKDMHNHFNERSGLKNPWIAADVYKIIMKNVTRLDSEIIYDWDVDYDYFGFKTLEDINYHDMLEKCSGSCRYLHFAWHGMTFDSPEAQQLNKDIFETICHHALKDSGELAVKEGSSEIYDGCPVSEYGMMC